MGGTISQGSAAGRVAVITGGASGIGRGIAEQCARLGMRVCVADLERQAPLMAGIEPRLRELGARDVMFQATDVSKIESVQALHDAVYAKWDDVGFLCNNAGIQVGQPGYDGSWNPKVQSLAYWRLTIDVDLFGVIHGHHVFVPTMMHQGKDAVVVNVASAAGLANTAYTPNGTTDMAYTVAKNGVTLLSESLSASLRSRSAPISVHVLCPYGTQSSLGLNAMKHLYEFKDESTKERVVKDMETTASSVAELPGGATTAGQISQERGAQILQECIEVGRFYCVTPDRTATTDTSRAWMLARAEDFIQDNPPFTSAPGTPGFRGLAAAVRSRAKGPVHKWEGPKDTKSPYAGKRLGEGAKQSKL